MTRISEPGVVLPHQEIGFDRNELRTWARELEALGCAEIEAFDHVVGAHATHWEDGPPRGHESIPYTHLDAFHEPFVLFSYLAAVTERIGFATTVLILPQRQTALVAKQSAELTLLAGDRLRLGVGLGWNHVEYEALGQDFSSRGPRLDDQIQALRELWIAPLVDHRSDWDHLDRVGINPRPAKPIPIWIGGVSAAAIERVVRQGDGWILNVPVGERAAELLARLDGALHAVGRRRDSIEVSGWIWLAGRSPAQWREDAEHWSRLGVDRIGLATSGAGVGMRPHLELVERFLADVTMEERDELYSQPLEGRSGN